MKLCKTGSKVAVIHGTNEDTPDESNVMKILDAWKWINNLIMKILIIFILDFKIIIYLNINFSINMGLRV